MKTLPEISLGQVHVDPWWLMGLPQGSLKLKMVSTCWNSSMGYSRAVAILLVCGVFFFFGGGQLSPDGTIVECRGGDMEAHGAAMSSSSEQRLAHTPVPVLTAPKRSVCDTRGVVVAAVQGAAIIGERHGYVCHAAEPTLVPPHRRTES